MQSNWYKILDKLICLQAMQSKIEGNKNSHPIQSSQKLIMSINMSCKIDSYVMMRLKS